MDALLQFPNLTPAEQQAILDGPGMVPPTGVLPNFNNPDNRNVLAIVISVICLSLVTITMLIRAYVRLVVVKKVRIEDYLGLAAFMCYLGILATFYVQLRYGGFLVHQYDVRFGDLQKAIQSAVILTFVYAGTMVFAKTAILIEWIRIFVPDHSRSAFFWGSVVMMTLNALLYFIGIILEALACIPLATIWEPWLQGKCLDKKILDVTTAYFNLIIDLFILLLPQMIIWKLQMTRSKKIGVSVVFSFGLMTVACAAGRVWANQILPYVNENGDTNYGLGLLYFWGMPESTCVLMVFTITSLPKAFSDSRLGSRIAAYLRSWAHIPSSLYRGASARGSGTLLTWGGSGGNRDANPRSLYRAMNDSSRLADDNQGSQTELTQMDSGGATKAPRAGMTLTTHASSYRRGPAQESGGIVCQTEFEAREDVASKSSREAVISRQHPWMNRG